MSICYRKGSPLELEVVATTKQALIMCREHQVDVVITGCGYAWKEAADWSDCRARRGRQILLLISTCQADQAGGTNLRVNKTCQNGPYTNSSNQELSRIISEKFRYIAGQIHYLD